MERGPGEMITIYNKSSAFVHLMQNLKKLSKGEWIGCTYEQIIQGGFILHLNNEI
jgi:hypothetical protein